MYFELSIYIDQPPEQVFALLRDKDLYPQKKGSPVLVLEKTTPEPVSVGTGYREVVKIMPFVKGEILSTITRFDPPGYLEEDFYSTGMTGHLAYRFLPDNRGTRLIQQQDFFFSRFLKVFSPIIRAALGRRLHMRMKDIKRILEDEQVS